MTFAHARIREVEAQWHRLEERNVLLLDRTALREIAADDPPGAAVPEESPSGICPCCLRGE